THTCKFKKARDVERVLKDLLGDPKAEAAKQPPLPPGVDPRFRPPGLPPPKRAHSITSDEAKNMVLVTGPADIISKAKDIVKTLDKGVPGQPEYKPGEAKLVTFEVPTGKAEPIAKTLTETYKNASSVRISTAGTSTVLVFAYPDDLIDITKLIKDATEGGYKGEKITLSSADASKDVDLLKGIFGDPDKKNVGGPFIDSLPDSNSIIVHGTADQVKRVIDAVKVITGEGSGAGGTGDIGKMRTITLDKGSAASLADALERMMKQMRKNPVNVISPSREQIKPEKPKPEEKEKPDKEKSNDKKTETRRRERTPVDAKVEKLI